MQAASNVGFRNACLMIVLSVAYKDRLFGAEMCAERASITSKEECEVSLDKRTPSYLKETWPGIGALVLGMEDEFPQVRIASVLAIGAIARAHRGLKDMCVRVVLEGLQDRDRDVRLTCMRVALEIKPSPLRAGEVRLILETVSNDKSEEIKRLALDFFLHQGPGFVDNALALASVEWLANLAPKVCSFRYLFKFGQRHASTLYFCAGEMERMIISVETGQVLAHHAHSPHIVDALHAALGGIAQRWGVPLQLQRESTKQACLAALAHFTTQRLDEANVNEFWKEFRSAQAGEPGEAAAARTRLLKRWSGFDAPSLKRLREWEKTGGETKVEIAFQSNNKLAAAGGAQEDVEDEDAPFRTSFELSVTKPVLDLLPSAQRDALQIIRYQVAVCAHHLQDLQALVLVCEKPDKSLQRIPLRAKETRGSRTSFHSVTIPIAYLGDAGLEMEPKFKLDY